MEYLDKIVALCEKKDVDLIFTMIPYLYNETEVKIDNWLEDYAGSTKSPISAISARRRRSWISITRLIFGTTAI